uniref:PiggyBac transposable elementderived protein 3like [Maylandia zebra] n=1 Tax=Lepeophtheirus salmonis TaxID=72036 RepID=A0A0K2TQ85_LEPSM
MGGVDLLDNMIANYAISLRRKEWYWCLYNWFLNVQMVQALRLYRKSGGILNLNERQKISLLDFTRACTES